MLAAKKPKQNIGDLSWQNCFKNI